MLAKISDYAMEQAGPSSKGGLRGESSKTLPHSTKFTQHTQQSTQTIQGDDPDTTAPGTGHEHEQSSDPDDSDVEENRRLQQARKEKQRQMGPPETKRRYTIEPGDLQDELLLTEVDEATGDSGEANESIFAKVQNAQEFIDSATAHPEVWCNAVRNLVTGIIAYQEQNQESNRALLDSRERTASYKQQLKEKNTTLANTRENEERLRESRNTYRGRNEKSKEEVRKLQAENEKLKTQLRSAAAADLESEPDPDDSDRENNRRPNPHRRATAPLSSRHSRQQTPATTNTSNTKSNNKYPDVKNFHGNDDDRHEWESWRMHLESKFLMSWELFETEVSKILYIRDHCKETAYDVVKARADLKNVDHYTLAEDMIQDLDSMFGDFDKESKADAELHNPKFAMGAKDSKETFDAFHARFTAAIAPLNMSEREKTGHLRRLISQRLKYRILDYPISTSYRELVIRLRQVDLSLRIVDAESSRGGRGGSSSRGGGRGGNNSNSNTNSNSNSNSTPRPNRYGHAPHVADRLKKEGRCFKCLQPGHLPNDPNAPCREKPRMTEKQVTAALAEVGIGPDKDAEAPPTYEQQQSEN